jgi:hypothetical protein
MAAERFQPAGPWEAVDGWRPPHPRPDQGPPGRESHALPRPHAQDGVDPGLPAAGELGRRTEAPIGHQYVSLLSARMHRLHVSQVVGEERRDDARQEYTSARMEQLHEMRHGNATPRSRLRRLAESRL